MSALGWKGYLGGKKQTAYQTYVAADDFARIVNSSVAKVPEPIELDLIENSRLPSVELWGNAPVAGDVVMPVNVEDLLGLFLKDNLGAETFTALEGGTIGEHKFDPQANLGLANGMSLEVSNDPTIANNVWGVIGAQVNGIDFSAEPGNVLMATAHIVAWDMVEGKTDQTPVSYGTNPRFALTKNGAATIGGAAAKIQSFTLTVAPQLIADRFNLVSDKIDQPLPGKYAISGQVILRFESLTEVSNYLAGTKRDLNLKFTCDTVGATVLGVEFDINSLYWRGEVPKPTGTGEQLLTLPFVSKSGVPADLIRIVLTNSVAAAY